jgi:threonine synthase
MTGYTGILRCERCGTEYAEQTSTKLCSKCFAQGVHVYPWPVYDLNGVGALPIATAGAGIFRFAEFLPVDATPLVSLGEGGTPLLELPSAGAAAGVAALYVKDEARNPTWSYKDRLAAVAVNRAAQRGADTVVVSSTGNHGAAIAAYAARLGLRCVVLTLESVPQAMKVLMQSYGATVVAVREPADRWTVMREGVEVRGWVPMSGYVSPPSGSNPFGVDGYKTIAFELWEQFGGRLPDVLIAPVAYGDGIVGIVRGFEDLRTLGLVDRIPRVIAAEPHGAFRAALAGQGPVPPPAEPSIAFSIASLQASWQGVWAIQHTGGAAETAENDEILVAQHDLARAEGIFLEASSAICYAVLPKLISSGIVRADETIVILGTSTGLKDVGTTARALPPVPVISPSLSAFDAAVGVG